MTASAFLFFRRVIRTPQLASFLAKNDLGNTPFRHDPIFAIICGWHLYGRTPASVAISRIGAIVYDV
jgi:hypothetical protein